MTVQTLDERLQRLLDRQEIVDVVHRYCRGVDRLDRDILASLYHPDATDSHLSPTAPAMEVMDRVLKGIASAKWWLHNLGTHIIEFDGDVAYSELYYWSTHADVIDAEHDRVVTNGGRYVDRFERRNGGPWLIAKRVVVPEWSYTEIRPPVVMGVPDIQPSRSREDPCYWRVATPVG